MNVDFDKKKMVGLKETIEYYEKHEEEVKANIVKACKLAKDLQEWCEKELMIE